MRPEKLNCWEALRCGLEPGGARAGERGPCPAATCDACNGINDGKNAGRLCWAITGTLCHGDVQGTVAEKIGECQRCPFFRRIKYEQGCHFQLLKPGLGTCDPGELHRLVNGIVALVGISRDVFACLAVRPLLRRIADHAHAVTRSASAAAYLLAPSGDELCLEANAGRVQRPERLKLDEESPVAEAARTRRLSKGTTALDGVAGPAYVAALPIGGHEKLAGVLELVKTGSELSPDDEWFLREFALTAGLGIENATLVEDLRQLKSYDKAKSRFVALLMHHIASPLATIACSIQALAQLGDTLSPDDRQALIGNSLERIASIQELSRRLLDLAAIRRGTSLGRLRLVRPGVALVQEVEARTARAKEKGLEIVVADRGGGAEVLADPDGLRVIFGNLIDNAIKYSTDAASEVAVEVAAERQHVCVRVRDRGIGIPKEEQARIFEEFHRASNVPATGRKGFGLGLAVVRELVDRYHGLIDVDSEVGVGTTVSVEFPVAASDGAS